MVLNIVKHKILIFCLFICLFIYSSCYNNASTKIISKDSVLIGKYKTEYSIYYSSQYAPTYVIYSDKEIYTCSFQGTNFLLEKDNSEEILSTTAPIQIIKSEIVK